MHWVNKDGVGEDEGDWRKGLTASQRDGKKETEKKFEKGVEVGREQERREEGRDAINTT